MDPNTLRRYNEQLQQLRRRQQAAKPAGNSSSSANQREPSDAVEIPSEDSGAETPVDRTDFRDKYRLILSEVEYLSTTVTELQKERSHLEESWAQRLKTLREEIAERDAIIAKQDEVERDLVQRVDDADAQLQATRRRDNVVPREDYRKLAEENTKLRRDANEREQLILSHDSTVSTLTDKLERASAAALQWEKRLYSTSERASDDRQEHTKQQRRALRTVEALSSILDRYLMCFKDVGRWLHNDTILESVEVAALRIPKLGGFSEDNSADSDDEGEVSTLSAGLDTVALLTEQSVADLSRMAEAAEGEMKRLEERHASDKRRWEEERDALESRVMALEGKRDGLEDRARDAESAAHKFDIKCQSLEAEVESLKGQLENVRDTVEESGMDNHRCNLKINELEAQIMRLQSQRKLSEQNLAMTQSEHDSAMTHLAEKAEKLGSQLEAAREDKAEANSRIAVLEDEVENLRAQLRTAEPSVDELNLQSEPLQESEPTLSRTSSIRASSAVSNDDLEIHEEEDARLSTVAVDQRRRSGSSMSVAKQSRSRHADTRSFEGKEVAGRSELMSNLRLQRDKAEERRKLQTAVMKSEYLSSIHGLQSENSTLQEEVRRLRQHSRLSEARHHQLLREKHSVEAAKIPVPQ